MNPFQGGGNAPMPIPNHLQPPFQWLNGNYGGSFCPNINPNGSYWPIAGQQQVYPYGVPNQGPAVNYNQVSNGTNGAFYPNNNANGNNQSAPNLLQIMTNQQQVNPYGVPNQGPAVNYNQASNGTNGAFYPNYNVNGSNQPAPNLPQIMTNQQQVALTTGPPQVQQGMQPAFSQQMQQLPQSHATNSICRGTTEMAAESIQNVFDAVANSIRGYGSRESISLNLKFTKYGLEMRYEKGPENRSNLSSASEEE